VKTLYLDTSAFIKLFIQEDLASETIEQIVLLAKQNKILIVISEWVTNESVAVVAKKLKKGDITRSEASEILNSIANAIEGSIEQLNLKLYAVSEEVVIGSRAVIQRVHPNASDALHLYIAEAANCDYFITADKALVDAIKKNMQEMVPVDIGILDDVKRFFKDLY
jgi:predicted nucleic acid-binding protein